LIKWKPQFTLWFVFELVKSATFDAWFGSLRDIRARARIAARLDRIADGTMATSSR
jgi:putative component of toxin-antitoxin plasmid stabilization module